jgi:hypothetical protein
MYTQEAGPPAAELRRRVTTGSTSTSIPGSHVYSKGQGAAGVGRVRACRATSFFDAGRALALYIALCTKVYTRSAWFA